MPFCSNCGAEIAGDDSFCGTCGNQLVAEAAAPTSGRRVQTERTNLIPSSVLDLLPAMVRSQIAKLPAQKQDEFIEEYRRKKKSTGVAYVLWFIIGLHYLYLGKFGWQFFYWLTLGGLLIWTFIDLFRMPSMVREYNRDTAVDVMRTLQIVSSG